MANFYYVKSGGTATGDAGRVTTTMSTGAFAAKGASAYYDNILAANGATTPPASGDFVLCSDIHVHNYGATTGMECKDGVTYMSVSDTAIDTYSAGAIEGCYGGAYILLVLAVVQNVEVFFKGMTLKSESDMRILRHLDQKVSFEDCEVHITGTGTRTLTINDNTYAGYAIFKNTVFSFGATDQQLDIRNGARVDCDNISIAGSSVVQFSKVTGSGVCTLNITNSDLSGMGVTPSVISSQVGVNLSISRSLVPTGTVWIAGSTSTRRVSNISISSVGVGTGKDNYHFYHESPFYLSDAEEVTSIYRTLGADYDGTNKFSTKIDTTADVSRSDPTKIKLSDITIDTDDYTSTITFAAHFARDGSAVALNSNEAWIEVVYPDGNEVAKGVCSSTKTEFFASTTAPTTESGLWTGLGGTNIQMSKSSSAIAIGSSAGNIASGVATVYLYIAVPSITVYACPQVELS